VSRLELAPIHPLKHLLSQTHMPRTKSKQTTNPPPNHSLFWFAWSARPSTHWISPVLAGVPFAWGNVCIFISAALYFIDVYGPLNGASAMAANGLARYTLGAAFPLFTFQMYERLGVAWATSLLGFVSVAMIPIPWLFWWRYGEVIRGKSRFSG
jgi:hypothetical protein